MIRPLYYLFHVLVLPLLPLLLVLYRLRILSFATCARFLALLPGEPFRFVRSRWYRYTLASCGDRLYVDFMATINYPETRIGNDVLIGPGSWIGLADIGDDVLIANNVNVLSGRNHHTYERRDIPIRKQGGHRTMVKIGRDVWLGAGTIITDDVSEGSVVAAGAVVTKPYEPFSILAGVPAKPIGTRGSADPEAARSSSASL